MSNYVPGGQKKSKTFKKCERELLHAISNNYTEEKIYKLVERLRESKIQALIISELPFNLSLEERQQRKEELIQKWKFYTVENIVDIYKKASILILIKHLSNELSSLWNLTKNTKVLRP